MHEYPAILEKSPDGRVLVGFPDFPEAHTFGDNETEALLRARDALATIVDAYIKDRQRIPKPSHASAGMYYVSLPALTQAKVDLYNRMRQLKVTNADLARRLGWHLPQVNRLLDVHHASRLEQLESAFMVLGQELMVAALPRTAQVPIGTRRGAGGSTGKKATTTREIRHEGRRRIRILRKLWRRRASKRR